MTSELMYFQWAKVLTPLTTNIHSPLFPCCSTVTDNPAEKLLSYNRANRAVAVLCNHQRAPPKTFGQSKANLQSKVKGSTDIWYRDKKWSYVVMSYFSSTFTSVCLLSSFNTSRLTAMEAVGPGQEWAEAVQGGQSSQLRRQAEGMSGPYW